MAGRGSAIHRVHEYINTGAHFKQRETWRVVVQQYIQLAQHGGNIYTRKIPGRTVRCRIPNLNEAGSHPGRVKSMMYRFLLA